MKRHFNYIAILNMLLLCLLFQQATSYGASLEIYNYNSVKYPGMYITVEERSETSGIYDYFIPTNEGGSILYDGGEYTIEGNTIKFRSNYNKNLPPATIIDDCTIEWGQSGKFVREDCTSTSGNSNNQNSSNNTSTDELPAVASVILDSQGHIILYMPKFAIPIDANGNMAIYDLIGILVSTNPIKIKLIGYKPITSPVQYVSGIYVPQSNIIYFPFWIFIPLSNPDQAQLVQQELIFWVNIDAMGNIYFVYQYPYGNNTNSGSSNNSGTSQGGGATSSEQALLQVQQQMQTNQMMFNTMSNIMNTMHETSSSIISNIGGNSSYDYDYDYDY